MRCDLGHDRSISADRRAQHDTVGAGDDNLTSLLGVNKTFTLEMIPARGAVLHIERTTPTYLDDINFLN